MAYIPTVAQLQTQIENELKTRLGITQQWTGKVFLRIFAVVFAGLFKLFYVAIAMLQKNIFVDTADSEAQGGTLERFGRVKLGRNPFAALSGVYTARFTGIDGTTIPANIILRFNDYLFVVDSESEISGTTADVTIRALTPGTESILVVGNELTLTSPLANIDNIVEIVAIITTPQDAEDIEDYRAKVLQAFRLEPQGGASTDYRLWALDTQGVRTAYAYTKNGEPYTVQVFVEADESGTEVGEPIGVPTTDILTDVRTNIEIDPDTNKSLETRGRRPLGVYNVDVISVVPIEITIIITGLQDDSANVLSAITEDLETLLYAVRPYIAGADGNSRNDTLTIGRISASVYDVLDNTNYFTSIEMLVDGVAKNTHTFGDLFSNYGTYPYLFDLQTV
jgi:uncharacterized phage protein gp47/JayE